MTRHQRVSPDIWYWAGRLMSPRAQVSALNGDRLCTIEHALFDSCGGYYISCTSLYFNWPYAIWDSSQLEGHTVSTVE